MARKGDSVAPTLETLLALRFRHGNGGKVRSVSYIFVVPVSDYFVYSFNVMELKLSSSCWFKICHQNLDLSGHGVVVADWWIPVIDSFSPPSEKIDVY